MFKDKVKVTVVALVMVLLMVLSITTDLFVGLADVFRAKAEEATPTDATPVTRDVTVYKELNDSDKDRNLAGAVIKVFKDSACTESITEFVLSYDGKAYGGDDRVVYKNLEERVNANASKAIAKLQEDTYYYQLDEKLFRSNDDYSKTGYDYNNTVGSFSIVAGDGVQEIKLDNNMFRPTEKVATPTDASSEVNLIVGDWYSTTLTLHLNKDGKDAGPLKDANGNLITATVKFQAKTTDGSVKVEVKYDASLLAGETITAFETIRTKGYEVCGHTEITDEGQQIHYPELKTSAKNSKDNSQHVKEGEVAKIVDTVNYSKLDSSVAYKVVTEAWDYNTQQIVVSDGKKVRKVTELHVDSKKPENGSFDVSMSFKTDGLGKHRIVIFEYVYDNKGNLISKEADFDAESQTIYIDKTPNKTGDRTVMFLSILAGMLGLGVVTLFVTKRKKK